MIAVRADAPWKTLKELIDHAQANPGKVRIGNSGTGSHTHFSASALFATGGAKIIDVPFGEGQAVVNLLGSRIEGVVQLPAALVSHVKSGDLRCWRCWARSAIRCFRTCRPRTSSAMRSSSTCGAALRCPRGCQGRSSPSCRTSSGKRSSLQPFKDAGKAIGFVPAYLSADDFSKVIAHDDAKLAQLMTDLGLKKK